MGIEGRVTALEKALGPRGPDVCGCVTVWGRSGWRIIEGGDGGGFWRGQPADLVTRCEVCGKVRPVIRLEPVEWRPRRDEKDGED